MKRKSILAILVSVVMAGSLLAGCGGSSAKTEKAASSSVAEESASKGTSEEEAEAASASEEKEEAASSVAEEAEAASTSVEEEAEAASTSAEEEAEAASTSVEEEAEAASTSVEEEAEAASTSVEEEAEAVSTSEEEEAEAVSTSEEEEAEAVSTSVEEEAEATSTSVEEEAEAASTSVEEEAEAVSTSVEEEAEAASTSVEEEAEAVSTSEEEEAEAVSTSEEEEAEAVSTSVEEEAESISTSEEEEAEAVSTSEEEEAEAVSTSEEEEAEAVSTSEEEEAEAASTSEEASEAEAEEDTEKAASTSEEEEAEAASTSEEEETEAVSTSEEEEVEAVSTSEEEEVEAVSTSEEEPEAAAAKTEDVEAAGEYKIGFSQATMASPFYVTMVDEFENYCKEKGVEPMAISADEDVQKQNQDIMDMIAAGIDALILNPINLESVQTGIDACVEADIPVITVDRMASSGGTAVVKRDNYAMGRLTGEALLKELGGADKAEGTILELQGTAGDQVMMDRRDGFESVFEDVEGIKIVQSVNCDYVRAKALTAAQDMIQGNDNIVAIYGHNDDMAMGGLQAAQEAGLEDVLVCGVDGLMEAVEAIANGEGYVATTLNDPGTELKVAADTALKVLNGEEYEEEVDAGTGLIDTSNAADYVDDSLSFAAMKGDEAVPAAEEAAPEEEAEEQAEEEGAPEEETEEPAEEKAAPEEKAEEPAEEEAAPEEEAEEAPAKENIEEAAPIAEEAGIAAGAAAEVEEAVSTSEEEEVEAVSTSEEEEAEAASTSVEEEAEAVSTSEEEAEAVSTSEEEAEAVSTSAEEEAEAVSTSAEEEAEAASTSEEEEPEAAAAKTEDVEAAGEYKIGFSQATMASPFYVTMVDEFENYCKEKGVEPMAISADEDVQKQNQDIMDMIAAGIDALILNPINLESVQTGIDACVEAGIPVITVDRMASSGGTAVVKRDNYEMGRLTGEALLEALGGADKAEGTILELQGTAGDQVMMDRRDGFESVFEDVKGIKIVQSVNCDYVRAKALTAAQDMIQGNDNIVAIYGHNDDMAMGGLQAAQEAGLEDVLVCGVDGLMEAVEAIADGEGYVATTLNDPGTELKVAADTALKVLNGEEYEEEVDAGTGLIDTSNAAEYVDNSLSFAAMK